MKKSPLILICLLAAMTLTQCDGSVLARSTQKAQASAEASLAATATQAATANSAETASATKSPETPTPKPKVTTTGSGTATQMDYEKLENSIREYWGENIGAFGMIYYEIDTGRYIVINDEMQFLAASTIKVAIAMAVYDMVFRGELGIDATVPYIDAVDADEAGGYEWYADGESYPLETLLYDMIVNSDNVAANMLLGVVNGDGHHKLIEKVSGTETVPNSNIITPYQQFCIMNWLYNNPEHNPYYAELIENLKITPLHDRIDKYIPTSLVAEKTGDYMGYANDIAIIYTDKPYILITLTDNVYDGHEMIAQTSKMIYDAHEGIIEPDGD